MEKNRALNILCRRTCASKAELLNTSSFTGVLDSEQLIQLIGHIELDRQMRAKSLNMDVPNILWVEILAKLPDTGYKLNAEELDLRFRTKHMRAAPVKNEIEEWRNLRKAS